MSSNILTVSDASLTLTQTLVALASGSSRQSTVVDNTVLKRPAANLYYLIKSGVAAPVAGSLYELFLYRREDTTTTPASASCVADDAAVITDAGITIENSQNVGSIVLTANTAKNFWGVFTTANLGVLGPAWGTSVRNSSGNVPDATEGNHRKAYKTYFPQAS